MNVKQLIKTLKKRWSAKTPSFFGNIVKIGLSISAIAVAMHEAVVIAGGIEPEWWITIYPYVVALPAGMAACAKLTRDYDIDEQKK